MDASTQSRSQETLDYTILFFFSSGPQLLHFCNRHKQHRVSTIKGITVVQSHLSRVVSTSDLTGKSPSTYSLIPVSYLTSLRG